MKTFRVIIWVFAGIVLLTACDHGNKEMFTRINPDGSCYREVMGRADSAFLAGDSSMKDLFPMKIDSSWMLVFATKNGYVNEPYIRGKAYSIDTALNKQIIARKNYTAVKDLEMFRLHNTDWDTLATKVSFRKKFRWFYTYYEFSETYPKVNPFKLVPVSNYLTQEEITTLYGENTALYKGRNGLEIKDLLVSIEGKANAWLSRSYYEELYKFILANYKHYKEIPVDSATFAQARNAIYRLNKDSIHFDNFKPEVLFDAYFKTKAFTKQEDMPKELEKDFDKRIPDFTKYFSQTLNYKLAMPGKIIKTSTSMIKGDTLCWTVDANRFFFTDYALEAKSRKANVWTFLVTGIVILLATLSFLIKKK
jgi:hypothetical protein